MARAVPQVDPGQLIETLNIVYGWAEHGEDEGEGSWEDDWLEGEELFDILGRITRTLDVTPPTAIALFQRTLALFTFCADAELSGLVFEDGFPGRELCVAASRAPVRNFNSVERGEISPYFDADDLRAAFRSALN